MKGFIASMMILGVAGTSAGQGPMSQTPSRRTATVADIVLEWGFSEGLLVVTVSAPTTGWVAVGFNSHDDIVGSELFMAASRGGLDIAEHHSVVGAGVHPRVQRLGRRSALVGFEVEQQSGSSSTMTTARLKINPAHVPPVTLAPGAEVVVILAYSVSPDFDHHSRLRRHVFVML